MRTDAWLEYGSPGTSVLSTKDIERAIKRLERMWRGATQWEQLCMPRERSARVHVAPHTQQKPQSRLGVITWH